MGAMFFDIKLSSREHAFDIFLAGLCSANNLA